MQNVVRMMKIICSRPSQGTWQGKHFCRTCHNAQQERAVVGAVKERNLVREASQMRTWLIKTWKGVVRRRVMWPMFPHYTKCFVDIITFYFLILIILSILIPNFGWVNQDLKKKPSPDVWATLNMALRPTGHLCQGLPTYIASWSDA